jgi:hypothetical protein
MGSMRSALKFMATYIIASQENIIFKRNVDETVPLPTCTSFGSSSGEPFSITGPLIALEVIFIVSAFAVGVPLYLHALLEYKISRREMISQLSSEQSDYEMAENRFKIYLTYFSQWLLWFIRHFGTG